MEGSLAHREDEESPSVDPNAYRREFPEYSPINYLDSPIAVHCKIEHAARKLRILTYQWQRLFAPRQWPTRAPQVGVVLCDSMLLRNILPFARRVNNLDGIVWRERPNIRGLGRVVREVYLDPGPFW